MTPDAPPVPPRPPVPPLPPLPRLAEAVGPVVDGERPGGPRVTAGRGAFVAAAPGGGAREVWAPPIRLAADLVVEPVDADAAATGAAGGVAAPGAGGVVERVVVPRDAPAALLEWEAADAGATLSLSWRVDLRPVPVPGGAPDAEDAEDAAGPGPGTLAWRRDERGLAVWRAGASAEHGGVGAGALFAFSAPPASLEVGADDDADPHAPRALRVRATLALPAGGSVRLALLGHADGLDAPAIRRALRMVERGATTARAARAATSRLRAEGLVLDTPDAPTDGDFGGARAAAPVDGARAADGVEAAAVRLGSYLVEGPGGGRSLVAGYGPLGVGPGRAGPWCVELRTRESARGATAALAAGDVATARDVLTFLPRHQDPDGRLPAVVSLAGDLRYDDDAAASWLLLVARYLAWTGDLRTVRGVWPAVEAALDGRAGRGAGADGEGRGDGALWRAAMEALAPAAESLGDAALAARLRGWVDGVGRTAPTVAPSVESDGCPASLARDAAVVLGVVEGLLGAEPDAPRGRLVLRPRPPAEWARFAVRSLALGDAAVSLDYRREGRVHRFRVEQARGGVPVQLVLAPELEGRLAAARVDGAPASLDPVPAGGRVGVPVQLVLDAPRTMELEMAREGAT